VLAVELNPRKQQILLAIIREYIDTAEPVGSRTIARKYRLGISPATIRNEMADLEEMGFIEQPHTSAGRVPSERGYRYYVDYLMQKTGLTPGEEDLIRQEYASKVQDIGLLLQRTSQLLSQLTQCASVVQSPRIEAGTYRHIQLIEMGPGRAMLVVVSESGIIQHRLIDVPESITGADLATISGVLNAKLSGCTIETIKVTIIREIYLELTRHRQILDLVLEVLRTSFSPGAEEKIYLGGLFNILSQPEFHNIEKVKTLLSLLEQEKLLAGLFAQISEPGVSVRIGQEMSCREIRDCSLVMAAYEIGGQRAGSLGVLGPIRMDYAKVISVVDYLTKNLSRTLEQMFRGGG
jgi:heat-inducible transcriptional repressor